MVRNHKWYEYPRLVTVNDLYSFDPNAKVSIEPFMDIIGRHFKQPKEGLGYDNSPFGPYVADDDQPRSSAVRSFVSTFVPSAGSASEVAPSILVYGPTVRSTLRAGP